MFGDATKIRGLLVVSGPNQLQLEMTWFFFRLSGLLFDTEHLEMALYVTEIAS